MKEMTFTENIEKWIFVPTPIGIGVSAIRSSLG